MPRHSRLSLFWHVPLRDKLLFIVAMSLLALAALTIRLLPLRIWRGLLGEAIGAVACQPVISPRQLAVARHLRTAIARAASIAPYRSDCLPQVIVGAVLCRAFGVPCATHLGTKPDETPGLLAHAWLAAGPIAVTGGHSWQAYSVVACFVAPRRLARS